MSPGICGCALVWMCVGTYACTRACMCAVECYASVHRKTWVNLEEIFGKSWITVVRDEKKIISQSINMDMKLGSNLFCSLCHLDTFSWNTNSSLKKCLPIAAYPKCKMNFLSLHWISSHRGVKKTCRWVCIMFIKGALALLVARCHRASSFYPITCNVLPLDFENICHVLTINISKPHLIIWFLQLTLKKKNQPLKLKRCIDLTFIMIIIRNWHDHFCLDQKEWESLEAVGVMYLSIFIYTGYIMLFLWLDSTYL